MNIQQNIEDILKRVEKAANKVNKTKEDIKVIAVTKTVDASTAFEAYSAGISSFGENRVQELDDKYEILKEHNIEWHMIGHLQKNKVKYILDKVKLIHSLDDIALAEEIEKRAAKLKQKVDVLIEINVGDEQSKFGIKTEEIYDFVKLMERFEHINVLGLMTVAPFSENPEDTRWVFKKMKEIYDNISNVEIKNVEMKYLSMGMTNDFEIAIEEGSNVVRIGTAIFGARKK